MAVTSGRPTDKTELSKLRARQANAVDRGETDRFFDLAKFLYPLDMRYAVANICRTTPPSVDDMLAYRKPVGKYGYDEMRKLADDLECLDCDVEILCDTGPYVLHVELAGNRSAALVPVVRVPMPAHRMRWPFDLLKPGDWFWVPGRKGGFRNIGISCQRQNLAAGRMVYSWQHLRGGTRVDRLL